MDYLTNTIKYLEEENKQLRERLKRMTDLHDIISKQRGAEERDYAQRFHQEEINAIREITENHEKNLKKEIKKLHQELAELNQSLEEEMNTVVTLRKEVFDLRNDKEELKEEVENLTGELQRATYNLEKAKEEFVYRLAGQQEEFKSRQGEIMDNYMLKLQEKSDKCDEELKKQSKFIDFLQNKLNNSDREKQILNEEMAKLISTLKSEEKRFAQQAKQHHNELNQYKKQNANLKVYIKNLELQLVQLQTLKSNEEMKVRKSAKDVMELKARQKELQRSKNKEIQREKSKNKLIAQNLTHQKKFLQSQIEKEKLKEKDFNNSKKLLISKIKEIEKKYEHEKTPSIFEKTASRTTVKKSLETFQSISLDNSYNKESPSVSCFLKDDKYQPKSNNASRKNLKIETMESNMSLLKLKDLSTPCFQENKEKSIKRTIKIRK